MKKKETIKYFNGERYLIHKGRWERSSRGHILLSHDVWNYHHPNDLITKGDGFVIHHINQKPNDDRIENLQKITDFKHRSLHHKNKKGLIGEKNPFWKDGRALDKKKYNLEYQKKYRITKTLYSEYDRDNHFMYREDIIINIHTRKITISHTWGCYRCVE